MEIQKGKRAWSFPELHKACRLGNGSVTAEHLGVMNYRLLLMRGREAANSDMHGRSVMSIETLWMKKGDMDGELKYRKQRMQWPRLEKQVWVGGKMFPMTERWREDMVSSQKRPGKEAESDLQGRKKLWGKVMVSHTGSWAGREQDELYTL